MVISDESIQNWIDQKTKPIGALGDLERIAFQLCKIQNTTKPVLKSPSLVVFAADHGIADSGVSAYPRAVTAQMVLNFLQGGAAINVFCKQHQINLQIVDSGVDFNFDHHPKLVDGKVGRGTLNFAETKAMHMDQLLSCTNIGTRVIRNLAINGCNCIGFGEMGIANTSSAALLMHYFTHIPLESCIGKGTGISEAQFEHKKKVLNQAKTLHGQMESMFEILCAVGGFEIIQMAWGMLQAKTENMIILVDGFISTVAYVIAETMRPDIRENAFFCHVSGEQGHAVLLQHLGVQPLLNLHMRLGEGSACALAYPLMVSAALMLTEMASFQSAKVDQAL